MDNLDCRKTYVFNSVNHEILPAIVRNVLIVHIGGRAVKLATVDQHDVWKKYDKLFKNQEILI